MAGSKRRALTADDLMRLQEGPQRKRIKIDDSDEEALDSDVGSGSEKEDTEDEQEEGEEDESSDEAEWKSDDGDDMRHDPLPVSLLQDEDEENTRFSSRVSFKPRTTNPVPQTAAPRSKLLPTSYEDMGISSVLVAALAKMSIRSPTEIQAACVPPLLAGSYYLMP